MAFYAPSQRLISNLISIISFVITQTLKKIFFRLFLYPYFLPQNFLLLPHLIFFLKVFKYYRKENIVSPFPYIPTAMYFLPLLTQHLVNFF